MVRNTYTDLLGVLTEFTYTDLIQSIKSEKACAVEIQEVEKEIKESEGDQKQKLKNKKRLLESKKFSSEKNIDDCLQYFLSENSLCRFYDIDKMVFVTNALREALTPEEFPLFLQKHNFIEKYDINITNIKSLKGVL